MGLFLLIPNFIYPLSLSLSLTIWRKTKEQKRRKTFMFMDCSFMIYLTRWRCISMCSKRLIYFNVPTCLKLLFAASATNLLFYVFSFYSPYVILLKIVLLIPLKYHTGNWNCQLLQYNIITSKPRGPCLPLF